MINEKELENFLWMLGIRSVSDEREADTMEKMLEKIFKKKKR